MYQKPQSKTKKIEQCRRFLHLTSVIDFSFWKETPQVCNTHFLRQIKDRHLKVQVLVHKHTTPFFFFQFSIWSHTKYWHRFHPGGTAYLPTSSLRALCSPESMVNFQESTRSAVMEHSTSVYLLVLQLNVARKLIKLNYKNLQLLVLIILNFS